MELKDAGDKLRARKEILELKIRSLLIDFQKETGIQVDDIILCKEELRTVGNYGETVLTKIQIVLDI